ncbi:hypothetical protein F2Q68_00014649 [Brassica cretica]|uniref:Uncharacterized protein n=2 Tax=Brassica cretica TaxID=69181 RepID=A0A8S9HJD4_BRACR|nr:hypothetical protein F2Q68_00014649 [Brassica cretica]KAF3607392.1 hypothetical protein DY000_02047289 [Brassica cretica]
MEFLETFECIWSSKEVIKVIIGRAVHGSDAMNSLCPTSQSDLLERRHEVAPAPERGHHSDTPRSLGFVSI